MNADQKFNNILLRVDKFLHDSGLGVQVFYEYIDSDRDRSITKTEFIEKCLKNKSLGF